MYIFYTSHSDVCDFKCSFFLVEFRQLLTRLSKEIEFDGLHTQRAILKTVYISLLSESDSHVHKEGGKTLESFYEGLCASLKYQDHSNCVLYFVAIKLLGLDVKDHEKQILIKQAEMQSHFGVLQCREMKFIELLTLWSYESKKDLFEANILPESAKESKEDVAELISNLVHTGFLVPTSTKLNELLDRVNNEFYCDQIYSVLIHPVWMDTLQGKAARTSSMGDVGEVGSPQELNIWSHEAILSVGKSGTGPVKKSCSTGVHSSISCMLFTTVWALAA